MDPSGRTVTVRRLLTRDDRPRVPRPATPNQVKAILAIARRQDADLGRLLQEYEVERPEDLTIRQASELIDRLRGRESA